MLSSARKLLLPDVEDLADIHIVDAQAGPFVPLALFLREKVRVELLRIDLLALDGKIRFGIDRIAQFREFHRQAGTGYLVFIAAGGFAQITQLRPHRFREVRYREIVVLFHKLVRVPAGRDIDDENGFVPQFPDRTPGNGHQIHLPFLAR